MENPYNTFSSDKYKDDVPIDVSDGKSIRRMLNLHINCRLNKQINIIQTHNAKQKQFLIHVDQKGRSYVER